MKRRSETPTKYCVVPFVAKVSAKSVLSLQSEAKKCSVGKATLAMFTCSLIIHYPTYNNPDNPNCLGLGHRFRKAWPWSRPSLSKSNKVKKVTRLVQCMNEANSLK